MNTIGKNLKALRQKINWTQGQVANALEISIPAYSKIETGITDPNYSRLKQMADFYGVHINELISEGGKSINEEKDSLVEALKTELDETKSMVIRLQKKVIELYEQLEEKV